MYGINRPAIIISCLIVVGLAFWPIQMVNVTLPKENNRLIAAVRVGGKAVYDILGVERDSRIIATYCFHSGRKAFLCGDSREEC